MKYQKIVEDINTDIRNQEKQKIDYPPELDPLSKGERQSLPDEVFALPKERKYPINDESHARLALQYVQKLPGQFSRKQQVYKAVFTRYPHLLDSEISRLKKLGMGIDEIYKFLQDKVPSTDVPLINKVNTIFNSPIKEDVSVKPEYALPFINQYPIDTLEKAKKSLEDVQKYSSEEKIRRYVANAVYQRYPELFDDKIKDLIRQDPRLDDQEIYRILSKDTKLFSDTYTMNRIKLVRSDLGLSDNPRVSVNRYTDGGISPFE